MEVAKQITLPIATCEGGMCEFVNSNDATCNGGACVFINSVRSTCGGGGCHFVHPNDTLEEGYCEGGNCRMNGRKIPSSLRDRLTY